MSKKELKWKNETCVMFANRKNAKELRSITKGHWNNKTFKNTVIIMELMPDDHIAVISADRLMEFLSEEADDYEKGVDI